MMLPDGCWEICDIVNTLKEIDCYIWLVVIDTTGLDKRQIAKTARKRLSTSPQSLTMFNFAADSLELPQTDEEADLSCEHLIVGYLVHQLFT